MSKDLELEKMFKELHEPKEKRQKKYVKTKKVLNFNKQDIVKGIILSEILGPPKGKRK